MIRKCFNCGAELPMNSIKCKKCGYMPDLEFARVCPNKRGCNCTIKEGRCNYMKAYQTCPIKNRADRECGY